ncbi:MAG: UPF0176 protein [Enterobacterales bacterium]|jgi:UPF0176 protein
MVMSNIVICALYKFVRLENFSELKEPLQEKMLDLEIRGTLLLADEGINGTVSGTRESINSLLEYLNADERLNGIVHKESFTAEQPFNRTKVKLKKEIVTMGIQGIDPKKVVGTYIKPEDWNELISDPDVTLIDTRNDYEYQVGTFKNAVNPNTETFREFPDYVAQNLDKKIHKKVAMFCTGGIRCEKSTAYMLEQGFEEVYHLQGGVLKYLEKVPAENSLWEGECFVFDERVTVDHELQPGTYKQCHACRLPITDQDMLDTKYQAGVSCPSCYDSVTPEAKQRFAEREKQMQLAKLRGESHLGAGVSETIIKRREDKESIRQEQKSKSSQ